MTSETVCIGIDVAKADVVIASEQGIVTIANSEPAINDWLRTLPPSSQIGVEATGGYHQLLVDCAVSKGVVVYVLNPRDLRHYALGLGRRGKTDRVDAQLIRRFISAEGTHLRPYQPATDVERKLALLQRRRAAVVKHRQALQKALRDLHGLVLSSQEALMTSFESLLTEIDAHMAALLSSQAELKTHVRQLESIPGIGRQTATQLAVLFSRVPLTRSDAAVAFVGLDPRACDSGQKRGRRRLSKRGPSELRRLLYNCAQAAVRTATWNPYYNQLRSREFPTTQALVILARKLLRIAFALWQKKDATFDAQKVACLALVS